MVIPRQTHKASFSSPFPLKQKMLKMRKFSIPSTFASVCWFSSLFALCFFSFLYLHPRDTGNSSNCATFVKVDDSKAAVTTTPVSSGVVDNRLGLESKADAIVNSKLPTEKQNVGNVTTTVDVDVVVAGGGGVGLNSTTTEVVELPNVSIEEQGSNSTTTTTTKIVEVVVDQTPAAIEEETDEVYDKIPANDVFAFPPWNCTKEERIDWLKWNLNESKIIKSTSRTRNFEEKIQAFLANNNNNQGDNSSTEDASCKVRIFLTWISPASLFGTRELLALESILKAHPDGCVIILSRRMDSNPGRLVLKPLLDRGHRILTIAPDFRHLFSNTPALGWLDRLEAGEVDPGTVPITQNLANLLRMAVLYKYGGVYFDTDMIILKSVSELQNSIGIQSVDDETRIWRTLNNAVLIFDKDHPLLWQFMEEFASTFDGFTWGFNGPYLATRVVSRTFNDTNFQYNLMSPMAFYPVDWIRIHRLFEKPYKNGTTWAGDKFLGIKAQSYGVHLWNKQTRSLKIEKKSPMGKLISKHCIICQDIYDK